MKLAITLAESVDGDWYARTEASDWLCIGNPLKAIKEQKDHVKKLTLSGGIEGEMEFTRAMVISNKRMEMRKRFDPSMPDKIKASAERTKKLQTELEKKAKAENVDDKPWHDGLTIKKLYDLAEDEELEIEPKLKRDDLIVAIEEARKVKADKNPDEGDE